jgi:hypothetical protein
MKTTTIFTLVFSLLMSVSFAQTDSTKSSPDTTDVEVVISTKKGQDSTIVRVAGMKIIVLNEGQKGETVIIDDMEIEDGEEDHEDDDDGDEAVSHWAGVRIGVNGFLQDDGLPLLQADRNLELDYATSISWDLNLFEKDFHLYKNNVELVTGLGFHFANYSFNNAYSTLQPTVPFTYTIDSTRILTKNRLKATYITAPLMLGFSSNQDESKAFRFAAGGQVSWRINSKMKQRYVVNGNNITNKYKGDYDLNPFLFHAIASVGYGPINMFATYGLNPLFQGKRTAGELTPFDVGIQLMF